MILKFLTKKVTKDGKNYLQIDKTKMIFETGKVNIYFQNLFNGNKELGETTNRFFVSVTDSSASLNTSCNSVILF